MSDSCLFQSQKEARSLKFQCKKNRDSTIGEVKNKVADKLQSNCIAGFVIANAKSLLFYDMAYHAGYEIQDQSRV